MLRRHCLRRRSGSASLAEFGPALFVFFLFILFPLIDLLGIATGFATVNFIAGQAASSASVSSDYDAALSSALSKTQALAGGGFGAFAKLVPNGGYNNSGLNLWVNRTNVQNGQADVCGPNKYCPTPVDSASYVYEYSAHVRFNVGPFINLSGMPWIGTIPGLGRPVSVLYVSQKNAEFPDGITTGTNGLGTGGWSGYGSGGGSGGSGPSTSFMGGTSGSAGSGGASGGPNF